jgi:hypothetical protein
MSEPKQSRLQKVIEAAQEEASRASESSIRGDTFGEFVTLFRALNVKFEDPSAETLARAQSIVPTPSKRHLVVRLLGSSLVAGTARFLPGEDVQVIVGAESNKIRLMYSRTSEGWKVLGSMGEAGWTVVCGTVETDCDEEGRFMLEILDDNCPHLTVSNHEVELSVPPLEEMS